MAALQKLGLTRQEATDATSAAQQAFNLWQLRAGNTLTVGRSVEGQLREIDYRIDAERMLKILPQAQGFSAKVAEIPARVEIVAVRGTLDDSLFNAVEETGESAELAMRMAQIFGYDLDFYTDPRRGDTFCILLEKERYPSGQTAGYGKSSPPNTKTPERDIRRCSITIPPGGGPATTPKRASRCKKRFCVRR